MTDERRPGDDDDTTTSDAPLDAGTGPDESDPTPSSPVLGEDDDEERFDAG
ncbi:hypothetical protein ICW40_04685 [Actinotalea ferrariae]|uniref:hypothetical protein n=1 Tax=Actinotalea ferrariae TaxID=1386098 RepID=UPI001C8B615B|nr:hypothetical protein [Actinotalea ferrariae]MBX9244105.1 hypothetical protein [Actinotalea ferrariae]